MEYDRLSDEEIRELLMTKLLGLSDKQLAELLADIPLAS